MASQLLKSDAKQDRKRRHSKIILADKHLETSKHRKDETEEDSPKITSLPMLFLTEVVKQLSLIDMYHFWASFKHAQKAVDHFWVSQRSLNLSPQVLKHFYPECEDFDKPYFHWFKVADEIIELCSYYPHNRLRVVSFEGCCALEWSMFATCLEENDTDVDKLFCEVEVVNFKDCIVSSDDLVLMAETMKKLRIVILTESLFHIYPDEDLKIFPADIKDGHKLKKQNMLNKHRKKTLDFLATTFPKLESVTLLP